MGEERKIDTHSVMTAEELFEMGITVPEQGAEGHRRARARADRVHVLARGRGPRGALRRVDGRHGQEHAKVEGR